MTPKQLKRIAGIIENELGFTNGWAIPSAEYYTHCLTAAKRIKKYLKRTDPRPAEKDNALDKFIARKTLNRILEHAKAIEQYTKKLK